MEDFRKELSVKRVEKLYRQAIEHVSSDVLSEYRVICDWMDGFATTHLLNEETQAFLPEAAAHLIEGGLEHRRVLDVPIKHDIDGLKGTHSVVGEGGLYHFNYLEFMERLRTFESGDQALFFSYEDRRKQVLAESAEELRLKEFKPQVLSAFVRNRLLDEVHPATDWG